MKNLGKYIFNTVLGLLLCIPVVTALASITAMHFVNFKLAGGQDIKVAPEFFKSFKQNFKQSFVFLLILGIFGGVLGYLWYSVFSAEDVNFVFAGLLLILSLAYFIFACLATYLLAKFENTTGRIMAISFVCGVRNMDRMFKPAMIEACVFAVPAIIIAVNPCAVSFTVGAISSFVILVIYEMVSAKCVIPVFDSLLKMNEEQKAKLEAEALEQHTQEEEASENNEDKTGEE